MIDTDYTTAFYQRLRDGAARSAAVVVPLVLGLVPVRSVIDFGCGDGTWLAAFQKLGIDDVLGIDGEYVERKVFQISEERFRAFDLTKPFSPERSFDLAMSLEVAEHLPSKCAATLVESLIGSAPIVLFSAAIPFQGGTNHVNEQWPDKWAELFKKHNYLPVDFLRKQLWQNQDVEFWYAQNLLLFVREDFLDKNGALMREYERTNLEQLCLVHPKQYLINQNRLQDLAGSEPPIRGVRWASRLFLRSLKEAALRWYRQVTGKNRSRDIKLPANNIQ